MTTYNSALRLGNDDDQERLISSRFADFYQRDSSYGWGFLQLKASIIFDQQPEYCQQPRIRGIPIYQVAYLVLIQETENLRC